MPSKSKGKKAMGFKTALPTQAKVPFSAKRHPRPSRRPTARQALGEEVRREARNQLEADVEPEQSAGTRTTNVSGKSDAALHLARQRLAQSLRRSFHHGRCPCKRSNAERWPRAGVMKPTFGFDHRTPARDVAQRGRNVGGHQMGFECSTRQ